MIDRQIILTDHKVEFTEPGPTADISNETIPALATAINAIKADALEDMADRFEAYGTLGGEKAWPFVTDLRSAAAALRSNEKGSTDV